MNKEWNKEHEKRKKWLFNYVKELNPSIKEETFINVYKDELIKIIELNNKWNDNSKQALYFTVSRWLDINNKGKGAENYKNKGYELKLKSDAKEEQNERSDKEKENNITMSELKKIIFEMKQIQPMTKIQHYEYLLLNLLTLQPPLRTNFYKTAKIIKNKDDDDGNNNFVLLNKRGTETANYIVNKDKVSNYKMYKIHNNLKYIKIEKPELITLLLNSIKIYPRTYLFEENGEPMSDKKLLTLLRSGTRRKKINFDMMRSIYITWYYKNYPKLSDARALSEKMRHTPDTARKNYFKIDDTDKNTIEPNNNLIQENNNLLKQNTNLIEEIKKLKQETNTTPEETNLYKKRKRDAIYKIKKGITPRPETLKKYNLKLDDYI